MLRNTLTASVALAFAAATLAAPAASARVASPTSCDARGGRTLAANTTLRLYTKTVNHRQRLYACRYRGKRNVMLDVVRRTGREFSPYGINGSRVFWVQQMSARQREIDSTARVVQVAAWNAERPTTIVSAGQFGFVWRSAVINPNGLVAAIADPDGRSPGLSSEIQVYDPAVDATDIAEPIAIQAVASAPKGSLTDLTSTPNTVIWRQAGTLTTAPFMLPPP